MVGDFRLRCEACEKIVDSLLVIAHVRVIHERKQAKHSRLTTYNFPVKFEFDIFRSGAGHVCVQINSIGYFGHQCFRKPHRPPMVVIFDHCARCETRCVSRVVIGPVVVDSSIHELKIGVTAVVVQIEEINHAELAKAELKPPFGKRAEE